VIAIAAIVATLAWLVSSDRITEPLRDRIPSGFVRNAITCPRCASFWCAAVVVPLAALGAKVAWLDAIGGGALGTLGAWLLVAINDVVIHLGNLAERD